MEAPWCSQRLRTHFPTSKKNKRVLDPAPEDERRETTQRRGEELQKHVTMAASSRCLTDRQYVRRKPLFCEEHQESVLKMMPRPSEEKNQLTQSIREETSMLNRKDALTPESFSLSYSMLSPPPPPPASSLSASGQQAHLCCQQSTVESTLHCSRLTQQSLSSSILEVQRLNPPLRPPLTSTVLHPTYTRRSESSRPGWTQLRLSAGGDAASHRANYWACAIPKALPPSPDRLSASWNPNQEYQVLLDYTYPLRPGHVDRELESSKLQRGSLLRTDCNLQDSGIGLDHSSASLSGLDLTGDRPMQTAGGRTAGHRSHDLQGVPTSSDSPPSGTPLSHTDPVRFSWDSLDCSRDGGETSPQPRYGHHHHQLQAELPSTSRSIIPSTSRSIIPSTSRSIIPPTSRSIIPSTSRSIIPPTSRSIIPPTSRSIIPPTSRSIIPPTSRSIIPPTSRSIIPSTSRSFIRSTSILPHSRCVCGDMEEFRPLPEQLQELQQLSRQVREVTAKLSPPVITSTESLDRCTASVLSSISLAGKQEEDEEPTEEKKEAHERKQKRETHTAANHRDSETLRSCFGTRTECGGGGLIQCSNQEVEALMEQLCGPILSDNQGGQEKSSTLMQHIQSFCSHLELLIQQLYAVSQRMDQLAAPTVDKDAAKSSLDDYQRDLSHQQPLTSCVLQAGHHLLSCINTTSPFLRDTLLLIERQSRALQTHTDQLDAANTVQSS